MAITGHQLSDEVWELSIGAQVRSLRIARGLDQQQLAEAAGASLGAIKGLEQGRGSTLKTLIRVATALGRDDWLAGFAPRPTVSPIEVLRSARREPRKRVYRTRSKS